MIIKNKYTLKDFEKELTKIGEKILYWQKNKINLKFVNKGQFKLKADLKANILIKKLIKKYFITNKIVSEENSLKQNLKNKKVSNFWVIDPIDGTRSFKEGYKGFVTQVCFLKNYKPIYSFIYAPALKKRWKFSKEVGQFINNKKIKKKIFSKNNMTLVDNTKKPEGISKFIFENLNIKKYKESGSIGLKACMVCDYTVDIFVKDVIFRIWDIFPAIALASKKNIIICDFNNKKINVRDGISKSYGLIVCRKEIFKKLFKNIKKYEKNINNCSTPR
tara:strand:+ start:1922 stop:2749 length:828 start_codon:yes stop_codon:yes gene_type:complete